MEKIVIEHLSKKYGEKKVLEDLNLVLEAGKTYTMAGPSGCGKTTFLRILMGLEKADSGTISGVPAKISAVFQENRLSESFSALDNVMLVMNSENKKETAAELLHALGLTDNLTKPVKTFSGGMKRRVALARALAADYDLLILDEPFTGLDAQNRELAIKVIEEYTKNKTVLLVSHDIIDSDMQKSLPSRLFV